MLSLARIAFLHQKPGRAAAGLRYDYLLKLADQRLIGANFAGTISIVVCFTRLPPSAFLRTNTCQSGSACMAARRFMRSAASSYAQMWTSVLISPDSENM